MQKPKSCVLENGLSIPRGIYYRVLTYVKSLSPEESCGMLAGTQGRVRRHLPVENIHHSPTRYLMEPRQQLKAILWMEEHQLDLLAIYHSHPHGPDRLSNTDLIEITFPETIYLLFFSEYGKWRAKGYHISRGNPVEIPLTIN